jgi:hypothetical protein
MMSMLISSGSTGGRRFAVTLLASTKVVRNEADISTPVARIDQFPTAAVPSIYAHSGSSARRHLHSFFKKYPCLAYMQFGFEEPKNDKRIFAWKCAGPRA